MKFEKFESPDAFRILIESYLFGEIRKWSKEFTKQDKSAIDLTKPVVIVNHIEAEVEMGVPDWQRYSWIQIGVQPPLSILIKVVQ